MLLAKHTQATGAPPESVFAIWKDIDRWTDFDDGIEWARSTDGFVVGGHFSLKPKGGPVLRGTITEIEPNRKFVTLSRLPLATIAFDHEISVENGLASVTVAARVDGPLAWLWAKILGENQRRDVEASVAKLVAIAERRA